jgi:hypothetical protein
MPASLRPGGVALLCIMRRQRWRQTDVGVSPLCGRASDLGGLAAIRVAYPCGPGALFFLAVGPGRLLFGSDFGGSPPTVL